MTWEQLARATENLDDAATAALYVQPPEASSVRIGRRWQRNPNGRLKFLLMGPKGGGKSSELRAIGRQLKGHAVAVGIDFGASGVLARSISAFDILYVGALEMLRRLEEIERGAQTRYFGQLADAYGGSEYAKDVPDLSRAIEGLAIFADGATGLATVAGLATGGAPIIAAAGHVAAKGLRLLAGKSGVVSESSRQGQDMLAICQKLTAELEQHVGAVCLLVDGLERMNGESAERFDEVFLATRLIANAPWGAVFAAPPCTITSVHSAGDVGFEEQEVYGLPPSELDARVEVLRKRALAAGLNDDAFEPGVLVHVATRAGSLPRHLVRVLNEAAHAVLDDEVERMGRSQADRGLDLLARSLARALTEEDIRLLQRVHREKRRPSDPAAARLFGDGRILALPASGASPETLWVVHPLLETLMEPSQGASQGP